jgi:hypothetical protein
VSITHSITLLLCLQPAGQLLFKVQLVKQENGYQQNLVGRPKIGELSVMLKCGRDLRTEKMNLVDVPDPYCVLKVGDYWVRIGTSRLLRPLFGMQ